MTSLVDGAQPPIAAPPQTAPGAEFRPRRVRLTCTQWKNLEQFLYRASEFWNYMLRHTKEIADEYMASPGTEEHFLIFRTKAYLVFQQMMECTDPKVVGNNWINFVRKIQKMPRETLEYRLDDLLLGFRTAKEGKSGSNLPQWKSDTSSHSVRFAPGYFTVENGIVHVKDLYPFSFPLPKTVVMEPGCAYTLSITRQRLSGQSARCGLDQLYGPSEDEDRLYVVGVKQHLT